MPRSCVAPRDHRHQPLRFEAISIVTKSQNDRGYPVLPKLNLELCVDRVKKRVAGIA
jgi:hypothetical protein